ncbi:hypothetical protein WK32_10090 [Burkholderia vietnamiensis]|uniref:Uncharacterized protein n=1 Tax=Burkholderia vietnamiensis TaxID=60552 RepID=A0AA44Y4T9_BURVI|nr:hypothetical protein WK32_10090 [Burkholderia vietnamiensis]PRH44223.1 hypothetical protein C6T65_00735 [Burkholderia vietnamiensis]
MGRDGGCRAPVGARAVCEYSEPAWRRRTNCPAQPAAPGMPEFHAHAALGVKLMPHAIACRCSSSPPAATRPPVAAGTARSNASVRDRRRSMK